MIFYVAKFTEQWPSEYGSFLKTVKYRLTVYRVFGNIINCCGISEFIQMNSNSRLNIRIRQRILLFSVTDSSILVLNQVFLPIAPYQYQ